MTMLTVVLLATLLACVHPWTFQTSHTNIIPKLTSDVILKCFYDGKNNGKDVITEIARIRLLKKNQEGDWKDFASKTLSGRVHPSTSGSLSGHIGIPKESFLSITWPIASRDTVGNYRCEVDGYGADNSVVVVDEVFINITSRSVSATDLLDMFVNVKKVQNSMNSHLTTLQKMHSTLEKDVSNEIEDNYFEARYWPTGPFALVYTETGCPKSKIYTWTIGLIYINQTRTPLAPKASPNNHLTKPLIHSNNYFALYYCVKSQTTGGLDWPRGAYCLHSGHMTCPPSFITTTMTITHKTNTISGSSSHTSPFFTRSGKVMTLKYCCRNDGPASTPITLPTSKPFYLYRYKGTCQVVRNMNVSSESLAISTTTNYVSATFDPSDVHPDGKRWNYELELCYYTPNKQN